MKTALSLVILTALLAIPLPAQNDASVNPLNTVGLSFGASAEEAMQACERAGLTMLSLDTGASGVKGYYFIKATGVTYRGLPASVRLLGGAYRNSGEQARGLCSVWIIIESDSSAMLCQVHQNSLAVLTSAYGLPKHGGRLSPEGCAKWGYSEDHFWQIPTGPQHEKLHVTVQAGVDTPIHDRYSLAIQYALVSD